MGVSGVFVAMIKRLKLQLLAFLRSVSCIGAAVSVAWHWEGAGSPVSLKTLILGQDLGTTMANCSRVICRVLEVYALVLAINIAALLVYGSLGC